jgi:hypothetical protein
MRTRQQQRQLERATLKRGQAVLTGGLAIKPDKADVVATAYLLARTLMDESGAERASAAARQMHAITDASIKRTPGTASLACKKGCGYCCHSWVAASAPEIFLLARAVREADQRRSGIVGEVVARSREVGGLTPLQRFGAKLPCPLLVDNVCAHYRERPTVCRQTTSLDLSGCIDEFEGRGHGGEIKVSAVYLAHARNARAPLLAALRLAGLDDGVYEMATGLARALELGNAEAQWLRGNDVLAGVARAPDAEVPIARAVDAIVDELAGLVRPGGE